MYNLRMTLRIECVRMSVIQVYAPTEVKQGCARSSQGKEDIKIAEPMSEDAKLAYNKVKKKTKIRVRETKNGEWINSG